MRRFFSPASSTPSSGPHPPEILDLGRSRIESTLGITTEDSYPEFYKGYTTPNLDRAAVSLL
jgi:hypothetical protein